MNIEEVRNFTLSIFGVTEDQPFGDDIITFRIEGKIFVCLWLGCGNHDKAEGGSRFACKLSPERNEVLRDHYNAITPAYHWNKKHWSDVYYERLPSPMVKALIEESYWLVVSKLPKAFRGRYLTIANSGSKNVRNILKKNK